MIAYIVGSPQRKYEDHVVVDVSGVGYEIYPPQFVRRTYDEKPEGEIVSLEIYYHASERQIRPILFGFNNRYEKQFFEKIITVEDVGPVKAARALALSVSTIAQSIESEDSASLRRLPGIGDRTAKKMIATLRGKVVEEALLRDEGYDEVVVAAPDDGMSDLKADTLESCLALATDAPRLRLKSKPRLPPGRTSRVRKS